MNQNVLAKQLFPMFLMFCCFNVTRGGLAGRTFVQKPKIINDKN